jgi:hypothetical protein
MFTRQTIQPQKNYKHYIRCDKQGKIAEHQVVAAGRGDRGDQREG